MKSNTYRRGRQQKAFDKLAESSADVMDYRARLCYVDIRHRHPRLDPSIARGIAEHKSVFVTLFQAPLEWLSERSMQRKLRRANRRMRRM